MLCIVSILRPSPCDLDPKVSGSAHRNTAGRVSGDSKTLLKIPPKLRLIKIKFTLGEMSHPHLAADVLWSGILIAFQLSRDERVLIFAHLRQAEQIVSH